MSVTKVTQDVLSTVPAGLAIATPTITSPVLSGTVTGTYTLAGTPTLTSPVVNTGTVGADPAAALGIASKQYVDGSVSKVQEFRLSLTTGLPVTTSDVTGAGMLYAVPYNGNAIALYDGTNWNIRRSAQFSLALTLTSGKPYDVFCYDNAGVPTLEILVWTNDTTRATAIAYHDGVLIKSGNATRRYLGSLYASGANTTEDSVLKRYLWNYYHRVLRHMRAVDTTDTWTYTTNTWRSANGNAANQVDFIIGVTEDIVEATVYGLSGNSTGGVVRATNIGFDTTSGPSAQVAITTSVEGVNEDSQHIATYHAPVAAGKHFLAWVEISAATGSTSWAGDLAGSGSGQTGLHGRIWS